VIQTRPISWVNFRVAVDLVLELMASEGYPASEETPRQLFDQMARAVQKGQEFGFVAYDLPTGEPAGMIEVRVAADPVAPRLEAFRYYVRPRYRYSLAGRRLLEATLDALPPDCDLPVYISTVGPLRRSFARLGFETVSLVHAAPLSEIRRALGR
jgi:GNAT superfamily N-acetyltransferase